VRAAPASLTRATSPRSEIQQPGRAGGHDLGALAVAPCGGDALLPGVLLDLLVERAVQVGLGDEAGAQAVRRQSLGVVHGEPGGARPAPQDLPRAVAGQPGFDRAGCGDPPEHRTIGNPRPAQPGLHRAYRTGLRMGPTGDDDISPLAFLVAFRAAQPQHHRRVSEPHILDVEGDEFRAPQCAGLAGQQQRPVAQGGKPCRAREPRRIVADRGEQLAQLGQGERRRRPLVRAQDAAHHRGDHRIAGGPEMTGAAMLKRDCGEDQPEPAAAERGGEFGEIRRDDRRRCRQCGCVVRLAPGAERAPVVVVDFLGRGRQRLAGEPGPRLGGRAFQARPMDRAG
jgi:hypothetical protein